MIVESIPIGDVHLDPANARAHKKKNLDAIKGSLTKFGQQKPIVIGKNNVVIAGNGTLEAAKSLGWSEINVVRTELEGPDAIAFAIADNRTGELAEWDAGVLAETLKSLQDIDFDLWSIGFDDDDLAKMMATEESTAGLTDPDDVPTDVDTRCKPGDLWILGKHRLLCGDSTNVQHVERLMGGEKADMVFTDPPYNHASDDKGVAASVSKAHADLMASEWDKGFSFLDVAGSIEIALAKNATVYVCTSWHLAGQIWEWMAKRSSCSGYCVWHKPNPMPSLMKRHWTWASELICYATYGKHTFNFPAQGHASNVWTITKKSDGTHPTQKPIEIMEHALAHSSKPGSLVLDLFLGSGSTLIACEKTGRRCFGMELDPKYCDVVLSRWEKFTGKTAQLDGDQDAI
jgi:DNA modification methylase